MLFFNVWFLKNLDTFSRLIVLITILRARFADENVGISLMVRCTCIFRAFDTSKKHTHTLYKLILVFQKRRFIHLSISYILFPNIHIQYVFPFLINELKFYIIRYFNF